MMTEAQYDTSALLVGDIGGTNTRLALLDGNTAGEVSVYENRDFAGLEPILKRFLERHERVPGSCALSVAGPVHDDRVRLTNRDWEVGARELEQQFGIRRVLLVNDFEALAWATLGLGAGDLMSFGGEQGNSLGNRVVLGPGTGLGVGALVRCGDGWTAVAGEGGHVSLAARTREEFSLIERMQAAVGHCSAERLLSGPGLSELAAGLGYGKAAPADVTSWAIAGEKRGEHVMRVFAELLATVAADLALTFDARGGVYLAGGILPRVAPVFPVDCFRARFADKGRFADWLTGIPILLCIADHPAFAGLRMIMQNTRVGKSVWPRGPGTGKILE